MNKKYKSPASYPYLVDLEPTLLVASAHIPWDEDPDRRQETQYFCPFITDSIGKEYYCAKYSHMQNEQAAKIQYYRQHNIPDVFYTSRECKDHECPVYQLWKRYTELLKKQKNNGK